MKDWFNSLNTFNTILICFAANSLGGLFIYLRLEGMIPIGASIGIVIFFETIFLLYNRYFSAIKSVSKNHKISEEVAQAMADKIIKDAEEHRRNREEEE